MTTAQKGRRDHYLPQSYLRGFVDPARQNLPQPLWHFDIRHRKWRMKSPKEVAYITAFYDYQGDHPSLELVESADNSFRELENEFQAVRVWLISRKFRNWHRKLGFLLRYMQMIRARSPLYFRQMEGQGKSLRASVIKEVHPDGKTLTVSDPAPLSKSQIKNWTITNMREEIRKGAGWMMDFQWALRYTESIEEPFVTSEAPLLVETEVPANNIAEALAQAESLIVFPLCWQACLFGSRMRFDLGTDKNGSNDMGVFRRRYREHAQVFLVSPARLDDITDFGNQPAVVAVNAP